MLLRVFKLIGSENGFLGCMRLPKETDVIKCNKFHSILPVRNFACLSTDTVLFIDESKLVSW